jgi:hypothetical protein
MGHIQTLVRKIMHATKTPTFVPLPRGNQVKNPQLAKKKVFTRSVRRAFSGTSIEGRLEQLVSWREREFADGWRGFGSE